jgi:predicted membrane protein
MDANVLSVFSPGSHMANTSATTWHLLFLALFICILLQLTDSAGPFRKTKSYTYLIDLLSCGQADL